MFLRHICGCVSWNGVHSCMKIYTCNKKIHSGSLMTMNEEEIYQFLLVVSKCLGVVVQLSDSDKLLTGKWHD